MYRSSFPESSFCPFRGQQCSLRCISSLGPSRTGSEMSLDETYSQGSDLLALTSQTNRRSRSTLWRDEQRRSDFYSYQQMHSWAAGGSFHSPSFASRPLAPLPYASIHPSVFLSFFVLFSRCSISPRVNVYSGRPRVGDFALERQLTPAVFVRSLTPSLHPTFVSLSLAPSLLRSLNRRTLEAFLRPLAAVRVRARLV